MDSKYVDSEFITKYLSKRLEKPVENYAGYMSTKALDEFSVQLVNYRISHELNQTKLAKELEISQPMISQYESGTNNITIKRLCEICEKIGIRVRISYEAANDLTIRETCNPYIFSIEKNCSNNKKNVIDVA